MAKKRRKDSISQAVRDAGNVKLAVNTTSYASICIDAIARCNDKDKVQKGRSFTEDDARTL